MSPRNTDDLYAMKVVWECVTCRDLVLTSLAHPDSGQAQQKSVCGRCGRGPFVNVGLALALRRTPSLDELLARMRRPETEENADGD